MDRSIHPSPFAPFIHSLNLYNWHKNDGGPFEQSRKRFAYREKVLLIKKKFSIPSRNLVYPEEFMEYQALFLAYPAKFLNI